MKQFILGATAAITLGAVLVGTTSQANIWNLVSTAGWTTVETDTFLVEAKGFDMRAYVFTPNKMDDVTCVFVVGKVPSGLSCLRN